MNEQEIVNGENPLISPSLLSAGLAACPCGRVPTEIAACDFGYGDGAFLAVPNCCGRWVVPFSCVDFNDSKLLAIQMWNEKAANVKLTGCLPDN